MKILIHNAQQHNSVLLDIIENGKISITECDTKGVNLNNNELITEVFKRENIKLNNKERKAVNEYVNEIISNNPQGGYDVDGANIHMLINGQTYVSTLNYESFLISDKAMVELTHMLMKKSGMDHTE